MPALRGGFFRRRSMTLNLTTRLLQAALRELRHLNVNAEYRNHSILNKLTNRGRRQICGIDPSF